MRSIIVRTLSARIWGLPIFRATLIQLGVFLMLIVLHAHGLFMGLWYWAIGQGILSALISLGFKFDRWWFLIQGMFPISLVLAFSFYWPSWVYLVGFIVLLVLYWSTYRTRVPYYPSNFAVHEKVMKLMPLASGTRMIDIGCGLGGVTLHIAHRRIDCHVLGIELAPLPWAICKLRAWIRRSSAQFLYGDYETLDFSQFDLIFAYLSPAAMPALWKKAQTEMSPGSLLLSYEFPIPGVAAHQQLPCGSRNIFLYVWRF